MKSIVLFTFLLVGSLTVSAQKKALDFAALKEWPQIGNEGVSHDGRYVLYNISSEKDGTKLVIQAIDNPWSLEIRGASNALFTDDNKRVIFKGLNDSLGIVELEKKNLYFLDKVVSFDVPKIGNGEWMAYRRDGEKELVVVDFFRKQERTYPNTEDFVFFGSGKRLLLKRRYKIGNDEMDSLSYVDLDDGELHNIWYGKRIYEMAVDHSGVQVSFLAQIGPNDSSEKVLWYYKVGSCESPSVIVNTSIAGMQDMALGQGGLHFSNDGLNLFFYIQDSKKQSCPIKDSSVRDHLIIWRYMDDWLAFGPLCQKHSAVFDAAINLKAHAKVIRIESDEGEYADLLHNYVNNMLLVLGNAKGSYMEFKWRKSGRPVLYLVSMQDGVKKLVKRDFIDPLNFGLSPKGSYVFWFDRVKRNWFTYEVRTGISRNITKGLPFEVNQNYAEEPYTAAVGMAGWMANESSLLIYDHYDIWEIDPKGEHLPINITKGYGRSHHLLLRCLNFSDHDPTFTAGDTILLCVFDIVSKMNGFAKVILNGNSKLLGLSMRPMDFYINYRFTPAFEMDPNGAIALKARDADVFLFRPSRPDVYPNIVITRDFLEFKQMTNLEPQKLYNWYTNELVKWKRPDGKVNEGILFKPEKFDPRKRYPLIVFIYERFSDAVNVFLRPRLSGADLNIPWYVSHGYLVFTPDIHYTIGYPGKSAYASVISGVQYLSRFPWVDMKKLGLQGHSWGGYETNYIVTHTHLFAAAAPGSGLSDLISESGQQFGGTGYQSFYEISQPRMGASLWERPYLYISNSPIFRADKVTTPLLIMHNTLDFTVHFQQAIEWFTGLRRLGKKVWMLQYTNEYHSILNIENELDYTIRLDQFFDHFLKGAPAPDWMEGEGNR